MKYAIRISATAEDDLRGIFSYIAYELVSVQNATNQLERLEKRIYSLSDMPERYRAYQKEPWYSRGLRVMPVDNCLVFYILDHHAETVSIVRVMYGGRNIDAQLNRFVGD